MRFFQNLYDNPTKKNVLIFSFIWSLGTFLTFSAGTSFFSENFFQQKNYLLILLIVLSLTGPIRIIGKYIKNNKITQ
jgi:magnesium-transporting ATPase (P-type)